MSNAHILQTILEGFAILAIIFGFIFEDRLIAFEDRLIKKLKRRLKKGKERSKRADIVKFVPYSEQTRAAR